MLNFRSYLNETLDQPYPIKLVERGRKNLVFEFKTDDGRKGRVFFEVDSTYPEEDRAWEVGFSIDGKDNITGKGDAYRIFATIIDATEEMIRRVQDVGALSFMAYREEGEGRKNSRIKLYRRMIKRFAAQYDYDYDELDYNVAICFHLTEK